MPQRYCIVKADHETLYRSQKHVNTSYLQLKLVRTDVDRPIYEPKHQKLIHNIVSHYGTETPVFVTGCPRGKYQILYLASDIYRIDPAGVSASSRSFELTKTELGGTKY